MNASLSVLRELRAVVLEQRHADHPDLAELARRLGLIARRRGPALEQRLARRTRRLRGAAQWRLSRRRDDLVILLCAWPAGHRTPVHAHGGGWGLELVLNGALEVQAYRDGSDDRTWLGPGDAIWFDHGEGYRHRARNLSAAHVAWSLHVYGGGAVRIDGEPGRLRPRRSRAVPAPPRLA